jgi:hypothetical protein
MSSTCNVLKVETNQESVWVNLEMNSDFLFICIQKKRCIWDHSLVLMYWSQLSQEGDVNKSGEKLNTLP